MDNKQLTKKGGLMAKEKNEWHMVNIPKWFLKGGCEEIEQPKHLKKHIGKIITTDKSYKDTISALKKAGYKVQLNWEDNEPGVDSSYGIHLLDEILNEERPKLKSVKLETICEGI